jgi:AraC-like DNA-binding protein
MLKSQAKHPQDEALTKFRNLAERVSPQRLPPWTKLPTHSHSLGYAAIVLAGSYLEFGDHGRQPAAAGEVLVHDPFNAHGDITGPAGATIVNVPLSIDDSLTVKSCKIEDPDWLLGAILDEDFDLAAFLKGCPILPPSEEGPHDLLARDLNSDGSLRLEEWADAHAITSRTLRRNFKKAIGMTPAHFRWRARTRGAWRAIVSTQRTLSSIAAEWAFSDQAHLTRSIRELTGNSPAGWRLARRLSG